MQAFTLTACSLQETLQKVAGATVHSLGCHCEVSVYDLTSPKAPLVHRAGSLMGSRDSGLPEQISAALRQRQNHPADFVFFSKTQEGRTLKTAVTFIYDGGAPSHTAPLPLLVYCISLDVTCVFSQLDFLESLIGTDHYEAPVPAPSHAVPDTAPLAAPNFPFGLAPPELPDAASPLCSDAPQRVERRSVNRQETLSAHIADALRQVGVPVNHMTNHDRMRLVECLEARGLFLLKGAVGHVAGTLHVTRYTVYYYLKKMRTQ